MMEVASTIISLIHLINACIDFSYDAWLTPVSSVMYMNYCYLGNRNYYDKMIFFAEAEG